MSAGLLAAERAWLDACLRRDLHAQRAVYEMSAEEFKGLWVSEDLVTAYLAEHEEATLSVPSCPNEGLLAQLAARFGLTDRERALLVLAVAADIDGKYESIFAYLNGAVSRRWPTWSLACRLLGGPRCVLPLLGAQGRLARRRLIVPAAAESGRPEMAQEFRASRAVVHHLMGLDPVLPRGVEWMAPLPGEAGPLADLAADGTKTVLLTGSGDCGRLEALRALAFEERRPLLYARLDLREPGLADILGDIALLTTLHDAVVAVAGDEPEGAEARAVMGEVARHLARSPVPLFVLCEPQSLLWQVIGHASVVKVPFGEARPSERERLWHRAMAEAGFPAGPKTAADLAARFRLGPARIAEAAAAARLLASREPGAGAQAARTHLFAAARDLSGHELARLARRVPAVHSLADLVLPDDTLERIVAVIGAIQHMDLVHSEWGLGADGRSAGGLAILFQGPSGTGKTMTASVAAAEAGLDLYHINLSSIVSKYIGETEKNLETIFRAARRASAVLMFDEADAIFGKRSEVKDAHDRYANIETAYLLQRIEEHDGPVVLATNLAKNIDQAFARRLTYVIEFPRPNAAERARLWRRMLAPPVPVAADVDCEALALAFELTGGDIRKAALEAAYLAAGEGGAVRMAHLVAGGLRESRRQGRMTSATELRALQEVA